MLRSILAVIAAVITWFVVATIGNFALRAAIPGYTEAEPAMTFTLTMMIGRLVLGIVSSLCAGFVCAVIARGGLAPKIAAVVMLILFVPVHYMLWDKFPIWYHLFFLITLPAMILLGAALKSGDTPNR